MNLQAKAIAVDQVFRPARDIFEATVSDTVQDRFVAPKTSNIKRYVNNHRTAFRPKDPHRLGFRGILSFHGIHVTHYIELYNLELFIVPMPYLHVLLLSSDQHGLSPVRRIPES